MPDLSFEIKCGRDKGLIICGADEAGRGPLAGPVVAAAVIIPEGGLPQEISTLIDDSKILSAKQREALFDPIRLQTRCAIASASVEEIDDINILQASLLAMRRAIEGLGLAVDFALIDGNKLPQGLSCPAQAIVGGDGKSLSIAAASILAKVERDRIMNDLAKEYTGYGWEKNAGYPTKSHREAIRKLGVTPHHRQSFRLLTDE